MSIFSAIETYLALQGHKYISPDKAGELREMMLDLKQKGQAARAEFSDLVKQFQRFYPKLTLERTSNWMNQAQILRPHFGTICVVMAISQNQCLRCVYMGNQEILEYR